MTLETELKRNWCWYLVGALAVLGVALTYSANPVAVQVPQAQVLHKESTVKKI
jgi:hypothetical protein